MSEKEITEETPLPLARMATITKPTFWIFIAICILLYIYNKAVTPNTGDQNPYLTKGDFIIGIAFFNLLLNLISGAIKNTRIKRAFNICCYVFESAIVITMVIMVSFK